MNNNLIDINQHMEDGTNQINEEEKDISSSVINDSQYDKHIDYHHDNDRDNDRDNDITTLGVISATTNKKIKSKGNSKRHKNSKTVGIESNKPKWLVVRKVIFLNIFQLKPPPKLLWIQEVIIMMKIP